MMLVNISLTARKGLTIYFASALQAVATTTQVNNTDRDQLIDTTIQSELSQSVGMKFCVIVRCMCWNPMQKKHK